jgi:hypothetical protein
MFGRLDGFEIMAKCVGAVVLIVLAVVGLSFLFSFPVYLLWNIIIHKHFGWSPEVSWLQAWGLSFLCSLLFKSHSFK